MVANELLAFAVGIICALVLAVSFLLGDIVGLLVESRLSRRWEIMTEKLGLEFDSRREKYGSLSELLLPKLIAPGVEQSAFCYGESLRSLHGTIKGTKLRISDFAVWDFHTRGPLLFRAILCVAEKDGTSFDRGFSVVKPVSILADGFRRSPELRPHEFPEEPEFSRAYVVFAGHFVPPWVISRAVRGFCLANQVQIDCLTVRSRDVVVVWAGRSPELLPELVELVTGLTAALTHSLPPGRDKEENRA